MSDPEPSPPPLDLAGAEIKFDLNERSLGTVTVNGNDVSDLITRMHMHCSVGHPPMLVLEIMGFRLEAQATLATSVLKWQSSPA